MTTLGISGQQFTIDGVPAFLLGVNYYNVGAGWHASDLDAFVAAGYNLVKVWVAGPADWAGAGGAGVSHLTSGGLWVSDALRDDLIALVDACNTRGIICDIAIQDSGSSPPSRVSNTQTARAQAITTVAGTLAEKANCMFDLCNEHSCCAQTISDANLAAWNLVGVFLAAAPSRLWHISSTNDHLIDDITWVVSAGQRTNIGTHFTTLACPIMTDHYAGTPDTDWWKTGMVAHYNALRAELVAIGKNIPIHDDEPPWEDYSIPVLGNTVGQIMEAVRTAKDTGYASHVIDLFAGANFSSALTFMNALSANGRIIFDGAVSRLSTVSALDNSRID